MRRLSVIILSLLSLLNAGNALRRKAELSSVIAGRRGSQRVVFAKHLPVIYSVTGGSVVMECEAVAKDGSPSPVLSWYFKGRKIPQGDSSDASRSIYGKMADVQDMHNAVQGTSIVSSTRSRLFLDCLRRHDAGEYTCTAEVAEETVASTVTELKIESSNEPRPMYCLSKRLEKGKPARIYMWTVSKLELEGTTAHLYCRAEGHPRPRVIWFDEAGRQIENDAKYQLLENGDLLIRDVQWSNNMGLHRCFAENRLGTDEAAAFLYPTTLT